MSPAAGTHGTGRRIEELDGLRGFALFGILVVNILILAIPSPFGGPADHAVEAAHAGFFTSKFFLLFSFLFGYSFTLQMAGAERAGASVRARTLRRCGMLIAIGAVHAITLWVGDILMLYGFFGMILLTLRRIRPITALIVAAIVIAEGLVFQGILTFRMSIDGLGPPSQEGTARLTLEATRSGGLDYMSHNLTALPSTALWEVFWQGPLVFAMFLLGYAAGRVRLAEGGGPPGKGGGKNTHTATLDRWLPRAQLIGLLVGVPGAIVPTVVAWQDGPTGSFTLAGLLGYLSAPFLSAFYVATLLRLSRRGSRVLTVMAPAGRMAATNYVMQSVLMCLAFTGYGLALVGRVPSLGIFGIGVAIYLVQLAYSAWWMRRFRYGPLEWVIRAVTYGRRPAMRIRAGQPLA